MSGARTDETFEVLLERVRGEHAALTAQRDALAAAEAKALEAARERHTSLTALVSALEQKQAAAHRRLDQLAAGEQVALGALKEAQKVAQALVRGTLAAVAVVSLLMTLAPEGNAVAFFSALFLHVGCIWFRRIGSSTRLPESGCPSRAR